MALEKSPIHPNLYEINTRVWLNRFRKISGQTAPTLDHVPETYWDYLSSMGMDMVWLMGIWATKELEFEKQTVSKETLAHYKSILPDFTKDDIIGSPYAIDRYELNPNLGSPATLKKIRSQLHQRNIRLILDFVPNHFGRHSSLLEEHPEIFVQGNPEIRKHYPHLLFPAYFNYNTYFAHGRDPYFGEWIDTVQVNYTAVEAREFMIDQLMKIAEICDGVRCDMAMMQIKEIFFNSWKDFGLDLDFTNWMHEFWDEAIQKVKSVYPEFVFIAECYWEKEVELHHQGFDFTYDKAFTDHVIGNNLPALDQHYNLDVPYLRKLTKFLENHDEKRSLHNLDRLKSNSAATLLATSPGMKLYYDGQWEGKREQLSVHLGRSKTESLCSCALNFFFDDQHPIKRELEKKALFFQKGKSKDFYPTSRFPIEAICPCTYWFYTQLLHSTNDQVFKNGNWKRVAIYSVHDHTLLEAKLIAFRWTLSTEERWVVINLTNQYISARLEVPFNSEVSDFQDGLGGEIFNSYFQLVNKSFLTVSLAAHQSYILKKCF